MFLRFDMLPDAGGWTVIDLLTSRPVNINGVDLCGITRREANEVVDSLNLRDKARARGRWSTPRAVVLDGPGPFELPLCGARIVAHYREDDSLLFELETSKSGQPILLSLSRDALPQMHAALEEILFPIQVSSAVRKADLGSDVLCATKTERQKAQAVMRDAA
jgi:hypothetical protein